MEKELRNLRKAMNSSTHKGVRFTEIQREKIWAGVRQEKITVHRKPKLYIYLISSAAVFLFVLLFSSELTLYLSSKDGGKQGTNEDIKSEWEIRKVYKRNGKILFTVLPHTYLSAGKPLSYLFSFKEPFDAYKGKYIEIYAIHKETGERFNVLTSEKISEPSPGYSSLDSFTTTLTLPKGGIWKYQVYLNNKLYGDVVLSVEEETFLPINIPNFVQKSDFEKIDWNQKAVYIDHNILGNENKSGVIGADMPSVNINQKWMWHLWWTESPKEKMLTVVGFHKETGTVHQILTTDWSIGLGGTNNGADAHIPSSVNFPVAGEWAILLYVDGKLFDILAYNIVE
ncbi:hypothetical protein [Lederbergia panacisoli]|uniref:hypothetical protein n=1 Tax=Lederbergia panacisoli TaxID=1255251 RepID=UPI00214C55FA|nr:hypothetical protein [Lederbergia panacisoli]MCR2823633.1 hypothetical protein [Lederbergia panacisoli]